jgi:hypothetical protein
MSHYLTYIVIPGKIRNIQKAVGKLLAPYDENAEVEAYQIVCSCVSNQARHQPGVQEPKILKPPAHHGDQMDYLVVLPNDLEPYIRSWKRFVDRYGDSWFANKSLLQFYQPDPGCIACRGTGVLFDNSNPRGKWDWWVMGPDSRFHGILLSARCRNPRKDELPDVAPVRDLNVKDLQFPDAIVTPDRQWHDQLYVPFVGCTVIDETAWRETLQTILMENRDASLVAVDCHT